MSPTARRTTLAAVAILIVAAVVFMFLRSRQEEPAAPQAVAPANPPPGSSEAASAQQAPAGPPGIIAGEVTLEGAPPVMEPLKRGADPVCAKTAMNDESALVKGGRIENVVVRLKGAPSVAAPPNSIDVEQKDCMYRPRVQGGVVGQTVSIRNEDATLHNVHSYAGTKTLFNRAQPPKSAPIDTKLESDSQVVKLKCDVHPWMTGYVVLTNNPYFAVTKADGKFEIRGVPPGQYTLEAWHEKFGTKTVPVTVAPDQTANVVLHYSAEDRG